MKLLFDHNLSHKLCERVGDLYQGSAHVRQQGLAEASDEEVWTFAKAEGFVIVTQDADFVDLSCLRSHPPKVIWLRCGNQRTIAIESLLRRQYDRISSFESDPVLGCIEIY
jgi:predicted nuclease of predicted toxin-antitoxin system